MRYLMIGGPLHGQEREVEARYCVVPEWGDGGYKESKYEVKSFNVSEASSPLQSIGAVLSVDIRATVTVKVLAHESILTVEELVAQFKKLRPNAIRQGVYSASRLFAERTRL